ncbi:MAG: hypothetical protein EBV86_18625, partial [Marivivens sp.]|nr:hypothetical protein [Marivivens sp.]NCW70540.1 hypothetical protein [Marivivens sp.]
LDEFTGAAAAYSLRNLSLLSDPAVVRVRRDNDDAEQDFTAAEVSDGTLATWVGAGNNGFVRTWYDQSGNDRHAEQTTTANQPQIVSSGSLITLNSKPAISFDGSDDFIAVPASTSFNFLHNGTSSTVVLVNRYLNTNDPNTAAFLLSTLDVLNNVSVGSIRLGLDDRSSVPINNASLVLIDSASFAGSCISRPSDTLVPNTQTLRFSLLDADNATASLRCQEHINGGAAIGNNAATGAPSTAAVTARLFIGAGGTVDGASFGPSINTTQEVIIYATSQSANRAAIEANINAHYNIF